LGRQAFQLGRDGLRILANDLQVSRHHGERVVDLVRDARRQCSHRCHPIGDQQLLLNLAPLGAHHRLAQLALDGGDQAAEVALEQKIMDPRAHRRDGHLFTHSPRYDDERDVQVQRADDREGVGRAQLGHRIVGDDHVPAVVGQRDGQIGGGLHPPRGRLVTAPAQLADDQLGVVDVVFDE